MAVGLEVLKNYHPVNGVRIGIAQSTVDKLVVDGEFPAPVRVGTTKVWPAALLIADGVLQQ